MIIFERENIIEFIEIYYKGDKGNEDRERIKNIMDDRADD